MVENKRKTGIDAVGDVPWGTHLCAFYQTKEDLIYLLVPYFNAGLENNEFCMWVISKPLQVEEAKAALKTVVTNLDDYIKKGQIEILDYSEWYTRSGKFDSDEVLQGWVEKEKLALEKGFDGLRLTGNTFWLEPKGWKDFNDYEATVDSVIGSYRMLAICSYSLDKCRVSEVIDVVTSHQSAIIRREDKWVLIQSAERKKAEEKLHETEQRYKQLFEGITDAVMVYNSQGRFFDCNETTLQRLGYSREEFLRLEATDILHPDYHRFMKDYLQRISAGEAMVLEAAHRCKDGRAIPVEVNAHEVEYQGELAILAVVRDITERKQAEEKLQQSYQAETVLDKLLRLSLETGSLEELFERTIDHLVSIPWLALESAGSIFLVEDEPDVLVMKAQRGLPAPLLTACTRVPFGRCLCGRAALSGETEFADRVDERHEIRYEGISPHTHYCVPILSSGKVLGVINLYLKAGHPHSEREEEFLHTVADALAGITERKQAQIELRERTIELEKANIRLREIDHLKSVFLASMSHELRTPLNAIIGFTSLIVDGMVGEINEEQRKQLTLVKSNANHLLSLINDILDISKIEAGKVELLLEEFRFGDVLTEVAETILPIASLKGIEILMDMPEDVTLFSDPRRMKQVLMNLANNAAKFTEQGSVRIAAKVPRDGNLEVSVIDTGVGIKEEDMDKLFMPFQQVDMSLMKKTEGTGLGLYLTKKLINMLGGDITVKSEYGKGSEFTFTVPLQYVGGTRK